MNKTVRYFNLKAGNPKQYGAVLKVTKDGIEDLVPFFRFKEVSSDSVSKNYETNINVDMHSNDLPGKEDLLILRVDNELDLKIAKTPGRAVSLEEISKKKAEDLRETITYKKYELNYVIEGTPADKPPYAPAEILGKDTCVRLKDRNYPVFSLP